MALLSVVMARHTPGKPRPSLKASVKMLSFFFFRLMQDVSNLVQSCFLFFFIYKYIIVGVKSAAKSMWGWQTEKASAMESAVHEQSIG